MTPEDRPSTLRYRNGAKAPLPFSAAEYARRLGGLRAEMAARDLPAVLLTSMANVAAHELGLASIRPGASCGAICAELNRLLAGEGVLGHRAFGYGHSFGVLSHYYGREVGLELREDVDTVLEPGMVVSMEPMLRVAAGEPGAGGYREHDILVVTDDGAENLTGFPYGPEANVIAA
ncbi:MAG: M24 family metallopeptidase [Alphaproteobacteria bacterium]|jgi:creatinase|nr:M24 family metallopeptidase [Alphaproteobacteria bacterium]